MRLFNPEWEAIKEFQHVTTVRDIQFDLDGKEVPEDHGQLLFEALQAHLPWLAEAPEVGILPIHGAPSGHDTLVLNRRTKLVVRAANAHREALCSLVGKRIDLGTGNIAIGDLKEKLLTPFHYLYSPCVVLGGHDEAVFLEAVTAHLHKQGIQAGLIPGKPRKMHTPDGDACGFSLMLHDISLAQSMQVQEEGIGRYRNLGCGIFVPHKSIKEVTGN